MTERDTAEPKISSRKKDVTGCRFGKQIFLGIPEPV